MPLGEDEQRVVARGGMVMHARKTVAALGGLLALGAIAYAQSADTFKVTELGAEAKFVSVDTGTGVETTVVVFSASRSVLDPPQKRGPVSEPVTIIEVRQESAGGDLLFLASYAGTDIAPVFTTQGRDVATAQVAGTATLLVTDPATTLATATLDLTFDATGAAARETDTDTLVIPGGSVVRSRIVGFHRQATATGTLTIDGITYQLSSTDAELQRNNTGLITVSPGAGS
jgi:hypothetical protein